MKKTFRLLALLAAVFCFAACHHDPADVPHEREIVYTVDEHTTKVHLNTEAEWEALLNRFCDYIEDGSTVTFYNSLLAGSAQGSDEVTFTTSDREEMKAWMRRMEADGKTVTVNYDSASGIWSGMAYATAPQPQPESEWVDLGLPSGLLWAKYNVGATCPEGSGNYYAWGETQPKSIYFWSTYRYCTGEESQFTKYCSDTSYGYNGYTDTLTTLLPEDDAATVNWGNGARTPTVGEWSELLQNCTQEWCTQNSVKGFRLTGPNGNSIFLPAAGKTSVDTIVCQNEVCNYLSSSLYVDEPSRIYEILNAHFDNPVALYHVMNYRYDGRQVRAVLSAK